MPEIAEISRIVHYLKKHAVGRTIEAVKTQEDDIIYGKVGTSASAFQKAMTGKKILDARQQGKYFWLVMDSQPHPLMHFGMSGWMKFSNDDSAYYRPTKPEEADWPPRFWKFVLQLKGDPATEVAFVDPRRLGRIRLVDVKAEEMRNTTPLKENGPDPVIDKDILTVDWLANKLRSKKVPVKALLLDQANISGIGNWVGDEIMYQALLHPEQYSNTFSDEQIKRLHDAMMYVCDTAVETLAESDKFPADWLMKHRWSKGKKEGSKLPNGDKISFLKVGGRTSAIVPSVQKKTAAVAGDVSEGAEDDAEEEIAKLKRGGKRKASAVKKEAEVVEEAKQQTTAKPKRTRQKAEKVAKEETEEDEHEDEEPPVAKKQKKTAPSAAKRGGKVQKVDAKAEDTTGRRRSGRLSK
ncbi:Formamidopyrimidine-DNA glycosylase N-terminal domain-containing protein [Ampelomyces quisqualis]|uniref:Formamidopyrimidine-DNA glycosylase N-terminal domain-containing protein n=1 Tax=Ampelomyces quisqualis TaxID=50730 RepID=A0A6A5QBE8_AMPQU|nr:Formamidopyrimidine-DNA glycosylase N-terminal domain-containing protein [Ampelomyces quisqualis]